MVILFTTILIIETSVRKLNLFKTKQHYQYMGPLKQNYRNRVNKTQAMVQAFLMIFQNTIEWFISILKMTSFLNHHCNTTCFSLFPNFQVRTELFRNSIFSTYCKLVKQFRQYHKVIWIALNPKEKAVKFDKT